MVEVNSDDSMEELTFRGRLREWMSLDPEVITLSLAMMVFSLAMQMTSRFVPEYLSVLGAGSVTVGLYGTFEEIVNSFFPYLGGTVSDQMGSRITLTFYGAMTGLGFVLWGVTPWVRTIELGPVVLHSWIWVFIGLILVLGWKELGLGATFALVKDTVPTDRIARGFASTEVFRRIGFLLGPMVASGLLWYFSDFLTGFQVVLFLAAGICFLATIYQLRGYRVAEEKISSDQDENDPPQSWLASLLENYRNLPDDLKPLLLGDTFVRFANGMVYVFFVLAVTRYHEIGLELSWISLSPASFFGVLLGVEMTVALLIMIPAARIADHFGQKPVVAFGFLVYAAFPVLLIFAPSSAPVMILLFAFSGFRFAGMPAHKAAIIGPARSNKGGTTTGIYYLIRNTLKTPAPVLGGFLFEWSPEVAFSTATAVGLIGVLIYIVYGSRLND